MSESTTTTKPTSINTPEAAPANDAAPPEGAEAVRAKVNGALNALFDIGSAWASRGLGYLKLAVETGARTLEKTAKTLETYQDRFKKPEPKPAS